MQRHHTIFPFLFVVIVALVALVQIASPPSAAQQPPLLLAPAASLDQVNPNPPAWQVTCIDCAKLITGMTSQHLTLDRAGNPHLAYGGNQLYYAHRRGSEWLIETVDATPGVGVAAAIALDRNDQPHILYYDRNSGFLKYARRVASSWIIEELTFAHGTFSAWLIPSIAFDTAGRLHVAFSDNDHVYVAQRAETGWQWERLENLAAGIVRDVSLALDANRMPHLSFTDSDSIVYARKQVSGWVSPQAITESGGRYRYPSLALDANGAPRISYCSWDATGNQCTVSYYSSFDGARWNHALVTATTSPQGAVLRLDHAGKPHLALHNYPASQFLHLWHNGSAWQQEIVESGALFQYLAMALDDSDHPHLSSLRSTGGALRYARWTSSGWERSSVEGSHEGGWDAKVETDKSGIVHVAYCSRPPSTGGCDDLRYGAFDGQRWALSTAVHLPYSSWVAPDLVTRNGPPGLAYCEGYPNYRLVYAYLDSGGTWQRETVEASRSLAMYCNPSMDRDPSGGVHIIYHDPDLGVLKYAVRRSGTWTTAVLGQSGNADLQDDLGVNNTGQPHVCYYDMAGSVLRYGVLTEAGWQIETLMPNDDSPGWSCSLALDAQGHPHVLASSRGLAGQPDTIGLQHLWHDGTAWQRETVYRCCTSGKKFLRIDGSGNLHAAAIDYGQGKRSFYALRDASGWHWEWLPVATDSGGATALAIQGGSYPYLTFYDQLTRSLKVIWQAWKDPRLRTYLPLLMQ